LTSWCFIKARAVMIIADLSRRIGGGIGGV